MDCYGGGGDEKRGFDTLEMAEQEYQRTRCIWGMAAGVAKTVVVMVSTEASKTPYFRH